MWTQEDKDEYGEYNGWYMIGFIAPAYVDLMMQCQAPPYIFPLPKNWTV